MCASVSRTRRPLVAICMILDTWHPLLYPPFVNWDWEKPSSGCCTNESLPWPSHNTHAPTSIHAMRRIRTALTHTHGAGGTAFTKKKASRNGRLLGVGPTPRQRERMSASHSHGGARHRTAAGRGGRRARGEVFTAPTQHRPAGQVKYPSPGVRWAVARGRSRHARSAHGGAAGRGSHFQRSGFAAAATVVFRSSVCESVTRSVYLGPASVLEQSSKLVVCFRSGTVK